MDFKHVTSSPHHPQGNGNREDGNAQGDGVPEEAGRHWQRPTLLDLDAGISLLKSTPINNNHNYLDIVLKQK